MTLPWHTWNPQADPKAPLAWDGPGVVLIEGDPYRDGVTDAERDRMYAMASLKPELLFVVVTEQTNRAAKYLAASKRMSGSTENHVYNESLDMTSFYWPRPSPWKWPLPNLIHMARVTTQAEADARLPALLRCPGLRGVWAEPGEAIDLHLTYEVEYLGRGFATIGKGVEVGEIGQAMSLVVAAGQTGPAARPSHPEWVRSLRDQAGSAGVAFNFRGWRSWLPACQIDSASDALLRWIDGEGVRPALAGPAASFDGKRYWSVRDGWAGRLLDLRAYDGLPAWGGRAEA